MSFLDVLIGAFLIWWCFLGFKRGFIEELSRFAGIVIAFFATQSYSPVMVLKLRSIFEVESWILLMVSSIVLFGGTLMMVRFTAQFLHQFFVTRSLKVADRVLGITFGLVKGSLIVVIIVWGLSVSPGKDWAHIMRDSSEIVGRLMHMKEITLEKFGVQDPVKKISDSIQEKWDSQSNMQSGGAR